MGEGTAGPGPIARWKRCLLGSGALMAAAAVWIPSVHLFYAGRAEQFFNEKGVSPAARALAERHLLLWRDPELRNREIEKMRQRNAEWDFMGRSFLVWSLANIGLRDPASKRACLEVMDRIIDHTLELEREKGFQHFLMDYWKDAAFVQKPPRSLFVDGEIALMLASRRILEEKEAYRPLLTERINVMVERMRQSPVLCAESYPDECWLFCNTVALAAIRAADSLDGTDHAGFFRKWTATAKERLIHKETGLLVSSFTLHGSPTDGPEGSSIWMAAHCLKFIDPDFAADQYARAKRELSRKTLGFGYAREWPASWRGPLDVDSGPIIPGLEASASSSGLAFVAARSFDDTEHLSSLLASLRFAGFPVRRRGTLKYAASNQVGDAVLLYAAVLGPLRQEVDKTRQP